MGVSCLSLSSLAHYFVLILVFLYDEVTLCYQHSPIYYHGIRIIVCCECCLEVNLFDAHNPITIHGWIFIDPVYIIGFSYIKGLLRVLGFYLGEFRYCWLMVFFSVHSDSSTNLRHWLYNRSTYILLFCVIGLFSVFINCHKFGDL